jgi:hypothetical protein
MHSSAQSSLVARNLREQRAQKFAENSQALHLRSARMRAPRSATSSSSARASVCLSGAIRGTPQWRARRMQRDV